MIATKRPFAYAVRESDEVITILPDLASALNAIRSRFESPSATIGIRAWFEDGTDEAVPRERLYSHDRSAWLSAVEARELEMALFPPARITHQVMAVLAANSNADYWEKLVLRLSIALLAQVDENLRGTPIEEAGLERLAVEDYLNLPGVLELLDGIPKPKRWALYEEGRHRLGFRTQAEEWDLITGRSHDEVEAEYRTGREALQSRPFVPSPSPFPSGEPEE